MEKLEREAGDIDFETAKEDFQKTLNRAYLAAVRVFDNQNQQLKGQPSLDNEDTGRQYKNDPIG